MFKRIYLEISNICNVQCSFCPVVDRDKTVLSPSDFHKIFKKIEPHTEELCLHLMGEPSTHPDLYEILQIVENSNVKINFTTNGLLSEKKLDLLMTSSAIRQVNFSLQAYQDNFPDRPFSTYFNPILNFTKRAFEVRPSLYINYRLWNVGDKRLINEPIYSAIENFFDISINRQVDVGHKKSKKLLNRLYLHFDSRFIWPEISLPELSSKGRCHGLKSHIGIHADGTVVPCCLDKEAIINLGNIKYQSLEDILNSQLAIDMKEGFTQHNLVHDLCKRCDYIQRFNK